MNRTLTAPLLLAFHFSHCVLAWGADPFVRYNLYELPSARMAMRTLSRDVSIFWDKKPLRDGLQQLGSTNGVSVWLDRRIDPNQLVDFNLQPGQRDRSLGTVLQQIATLVQADAALIENVIYIGPTSTTARLQRAAVGLHDVLSKTQRSNQTEFRLMRWPELSTPGDLFSGLSEQWKIRIKHDLPHDLLHQGELIQPCTLATQLTLVCGGFELQPNLIGPANFELEQLDDRTKWQCTYKTQSLNPKSLQPAELTRLKKIYAGSSLIERAGQCTLIGSTRFHIEFLKPHVAARDRNAGLDKLRFTFEAENKPAAVVINSLAASIGFEVTWDNACAASHRERLLTFNVTSATIDELLKAFSEAANLSVTRTRNSVSIKP